MSPTARFKTFKPSDFKTFFRLILALMPAAPTLAQSSPDSINLTPLNPDYLGPAFFTYEPDERYYPNEETFWLSPSEWVIRQQSVRSQQVHSLGLWADRTLSGSQRAVPTNESYLRLGFATQSETGKLAQLEPEARFRLDLPTVEEKLRLVIESDSEENLPLSERQRDRQLTSETRTEGDITGALRYLGQLSDTVNLSTDVGIRGGLPLNTFARVRSSGYFKLSEDWFMHVDQRLYYFNQDGWGESTWVAFDRTFGEWDARSASELRWVHRNREFEFSQIFSGFHRANNRSTFNPRLGILGESQPGWRTTEYFADLNWRYRLYDDWLYSEVIPAIRFRREDSFDSHSSVTLRIEMFFARNFR